VCNKNIFVMVISYSKQYRSFDKMVSNPNSCTLLGEMSEQAFFSSGVQNDGYMHLVDSALFLLALDDEAPADPNAVTRNFLHGDGTNRYMIIRTINLMDKSAID